MSICKQQVAFEPMQFVSPTQIIIGAELKHGGGSQPIIGDVPITSEDGVGPGKIGGYPHEITQVLVLQYRERGRRLPVIRWAKQYLWRGQLSRERLEMLVVEIEFARELGRTLNVFE